MNAKIKSKANRRLTQIYADRFLENHLRDFVPVYLRVSAFICGFSFLRVHSRWFCQLVRLPGFSGNSWFNIRFTIKIHDFFAEELVRILDGAFWEQQSEISVAVFQELKPIRIIFEQNRTVFRDRLSGLTSASHDLGNSPFFD